MKARNKQGGQSAAINNAPGAAAPETSGAAAAAPGPASATAGTSPAGEGGAGAPSDAVLVLLGTNLLPSMVEIAGAGVQLGEIVAAAHTASGLSVNDWNALDEAARDKLLIEHVEALNQAAREVEERARLEAEERERLEVEERQRQAEARAQAAQVQQQAVAGQSAAQQQGARAFPYTVLVRNDSHIELVDTYSGAILSPGGTARVELRDEEHEQGFVDNLRALLERNHVPLDKLKVDLA